ncbi:helix-turn-helix domain-containing protein [Streptomyces syringium]|uniref:helix-turn-helix domain-containing protein n=1 Tax=Streptomyces syringium TaxID=76729 RepID=UPI003AAE490F
MPDDFWQRPDIRNALAAWDMGAVVRGFRQFTGASQGAVATLVNIDQAEVSRLERGRKRLRDRSQLLVWAKALGVPPNLVTAAPANASSSASIAVLLGTPLDVSPENMRILPSSENDALALDGLLVDLQRRDNAGGANVLLADARRSLQSAIRAIAEGLTSAREVQAHGAAAQLAQMAGWLSLDGGRPEDARRYLGAALYCAHTVGDLRLAGSILGYLSLTALYDDAPTEALALARTAYDTNRGGGQNRVTTMLATRLARALAANGEAAECRRLLREADHHHDTFNQICAVPVWLDYFDEPELRAQQGTCLMQIGELDEAEAHLTAALTLCRDRGSERLRDQVNYCLRLADIAVAKGDLDAACAQAGTALTINRTISSARMTANCSDFARRLAPHRAHKGVGELIEAAARPH